MMIIQAVYPCHVHTVLLTVVMTVRYIKSAITSTRHASEQRGAICWMRMWLVYYC